MMSRAALELGFVFAGDRRIATTREPVPRPAPAFILDRDADSCAWAVGAHIDPALAAALDALASEEAPAADHAAPPRHERRYRDLLGDDVTAGPRFAFPDALAEPSHPIVVVDREDSLAHHFRGWVPGEIAAGSAPVMAVVVDGHPASVCFSARSSPVAAAAGLETAAPFRGRGYARSVTLAWAHAIRASGRTPVYSTAWTNAASLANARKVGLLLCGSSWSVSAPSP